MRAEWRLDCTAYIDRSCFVWQELKHRKSSLRRRDEEHEVDNQGTAQQRQQILIDLQAKVEEGERELKVQRKLQEDVELEIATLRGRIAHGAKEQAVWENDLAVKEQQAREESMVELRRLRRLHPGLAAAIAAEQSAGSAAALM